MKEYNPEVEAIKAELDEYRMQRDDLLSMIANWIVDVQDKGVDFENWKDSYTDASFTKNSLVRELIDKEVELVRNFRKD